jgi:hypothetical protein
MRWRAAASYESAHFCNLILGEERYERQCNQHG